MYETKYGLWKYYLKGERPFRTNGSLKGRRTRTVNITVYKARLVAKGLSQVQGVDYDETFSPVAMLKSVGIMLAVVAFFDYEIWQMDVKTSFP